jgi:1-acylglycerone phosphate reductase
MNLNFFGAVRTVKEFTSLLIQSGAGHIVNISSGTSVMPIPYLAIYGAAKAALNAWSDTLRVELEPFKCVQYSPCCTIHC